MARPKTKTLQQTEQANDQAARIILNEPEKYAGLPFEWAKLWATRHGIPVATLPARA